jgi:hypothetical protein
MLQEDLLGSQGALEASKQNTANTKPVTRVQHVLAALGISYKCCQGVPETFFDKFS